MKALLIAFSVLTMMVACSKKDAKSDFKQQREEANKDYRQDMQDVKEDVQEESKDYRQNMQDIKEDATKAEQKREKKINDAAEDLRQKQENAGAGVEEE